MGQSCRFARKRDLDPRSILECLRLKTINSHICLSYILIAYSLYIPVSVTLFLILCVALMIS